MNKRLLIKNIAGETTESERQEVSKWISADKMNESYYINLMNLVVCKDMLKERHHIFSELELNERLQGLNNKIGIKNGSPLKVSGKKHKIFNSRFYLYLSAAASVLLLLSLLFNIYQFRSKEAPEVTTPLAMGLRTDVINTFYTERGVKGKIVLEDSTVVWLNSDSRIIYPEHFSNDLREVKFEGEGFFEVKKNSEWPMIVTTEKGMSIKVLGTKFHIRSYNNDETEQATLFTGKIQLAKLVKGKSGIMEKRTIDMIPNEVVVFNKTGVELISQKADTTKKVAWKRGELLFEETPMSEVVKMLERWHGAKIVVKESSVLNYRFTGSFNSESLIQILELIKFTSPIDYSIVDNVAYLKVRKI
ncbi:MAG: FecR family protein [Bacteroidales bacterium]